jgi:hypothetical protein
MRALRPPHEGLIGLLAGRADIVDPGSRQIQNDLRTDRLDASRTPRKIDDPIPVGGPLAKRRPLEQPQARAVLLRSERIVDAEAIGPVDHVFAIGRDRFEPPAITQIGGERDFAVEVGSDTAIVERRVRRPEAFQEREPEVEMPAADIVLVVEREAHREGPAAIRPKTNQLFARSHGRLCHLDGAEEARRRAGEGPDGGAGLEIPQAAMQDARRAARCAVGEIGLFREQYLVARSRQLPSRTGTVDAPADDDDIETICAGCCPCHSLERCSAKNRRLELSASSEILKIECLAIVMQKSYTACAQAPFRRSCEHMVRRRPGFRTRTQGGSCRGRRQFARAQPLPTVAMTILHRARRSAGMPDQGRAAIAAVSARPRRVRSQASRARHRRPGWAAGNPAATRRR